MINLKLDNYFFMHNFYFQDFKRFTKYNDWIFVNSDDSPNSAPINGCFAISNLSETDGIKSRFAYSIDIKGNEEIRFLFLNLTDVDLNDFNNKVWIQIDNNLPHLISVNMDFNPDCTVLSTIHFLPNVIGEFYLGKLLSITLPIRNIQVTFNYSLNGAENAINCASVAAINENQMYFIQFNNECNTGVELTNDNNIKMVSVMTHPIGIDDESIFLGYHLDESGFNIGFKLGETRLSENNIIDIVDSINFYSFNVRFDNQEIVEVYFQMLKDASTMFVAQIDKNDIEKKILQSEKLLIGICYDKNEIITYEYSLVEFNKSINFIKSTLQSKLKTQNNPNIETKSWDIK